jgi:hypothetical protein
VDNFWDKLAKQWSPPLWGNLAITIPWVIGLAWFFYSSSVDRRIAARERTTQGTIRVHDVPNHNRYGYDYSVDGADLHGWQIPDRDFQIGQMVRVYYDPLEPSTSSLSSFTAHTDENIGPAVFCSIGTLIVVLVIAFSRRRVRRGRPYYK